MDPVGSLIGAVLIGLGTMLMYGAFKNRRLFGEDGVITKALSTGSLASLDDAPEAFARTGARSDPDNQRVGSRANPRLAPVRDAVDAVAFVDRGLAAQIDVRVLLVSADDSRNDLMPLAQLLTIADAKGLTASTAIIRAYVKEVTDESI